MYKDKENQDTNILQIRKIFLHLQQEISRDTDEVIR